MDIFKCKYLTHENEEILGFCLNQNCQKATKYCYECLTTIHSDHQNDCIRFSKINQYINEYIIVYNQSSKQLKEISAQLQFCFEQILKIMEQDIKKLEKMTQQMQNKDYLTFQSQINITKKFYSKEKENQIQKQIIQLNNILDTIKNMVIDLTKSEDQISSDDQNYIKIKEINDESEDKKQQNIKESERLCKEGVALSNLNKNQEAIEFYDKAISMNLKYDKAWYNKGSALDSLNKYYEAIECYDKAISINPKYDKAWQNKGFALRNLNKYYEAIECYDKAISINPKDDKVWYNKAFVLRNLNKFQEAIECYDKAISINPKDDKIWNNKGSTLDSLKKYQEAIECYDKAISINPKDDKIWNNKGSALDSLNKYQEAIQCYDKAISINPLYDLALSNKGLALHNQKKYMDAILCFDQALSIKIIPVRLKRKADSLFELGKKSEAKKIYLAALEQGSNEKDYIQKQLSKL